MYRCTGFLFGCVAHAKCPAGGVQLPRYVGFFGTLAISVRDASFQPEQASSKLSKNHQISCYLDHFGVVFSIFPYFAQCEHYFVPEANTPVIRSGQATVHWPGTQKVSTNQCLLFFTRFDGMACLI